MNETRAPKRDTHLWHPFSDMSAVRSDEFVLERGEDVWLYDTAGKRYLDGTASLWYANVGHGRSESQTPCASRWADWRPMPSSTPGHPARA